MNRKAFTLVEVCLVMAILAVVGGFGLAANIGAYRNAVVRGEAGFVAGLLRRARSQAMNNISRSPHGLHFGDGQYVLFAGTEWDSRNLRADISFPASPGITVSGPNELIFLQLSGSPKNAGNINVNGSGKTLTISINSVGQINAP